MQGRNVYTAMFEGSLRELWFRKQPDSECKLFRVVPKEAFTIVCSMERRLAKYNVASVWDAFDDIAIDFLHPNYPFILYMYEETK